VGFASDNGPAVMAYLADDLSLEVLEAVERLVTVAPVLLFVVAHPILSGAKAIVRGSVLHGIIAETLKIGVAGVSVVSHCAFLD